MEKDQDFSGFSFSYCPQTQLGRANSVAAPKSAHAVYPIRRIQILSTKYGEQPLIRIYGLSSLTIEATYSILMRRLRCPGKCSSHKIELQDTCADDIVQVLVDYGFPRHLMTLRDI